MSVRSHFSIPNSNKHDANQIDGVPVVGGLEALASTIAGGVHGVIVAIGDNRVARVDRDLKFKAAVFALVGAVHPLASISPSSRIAEHVIIGPRVDHMRRRNQVGPHSILAAGSIADHDTQDRYRLPSAPRLAAGGRGAG